MLLQSSKAAPDSDKFPLPTISEHEVLDEPKAEKKGITMAADSFGIPLMPTESNPAPVQYLGGCDIHLPGQSPVQGLQEPRQANYT